MEEGGSFRRLSSLPSIQSRARGGRADSTSHSFEPFARTYRRSDGRAVVAPLVVVAWGDNI